MKIYTDIEQQSPEWFAIRKGKMTASNAQAIWNAWKWLETYIYELMAESISSWEKETYSNEHTNRGNEFEPIARSLYELETWCTVEQVTFVEYNDMIGCSPDWFIWDDWWLEIKCQNDVKHMKLIISWEKEIDSAYIWQVQFNLWVTKRKWWDLCFFNPNFEKSIITFRIYPDTDKFSKIEKWLEIGINMIREIKSKF